MTKQSIEIKRLLHECNIDMGTFGLIELQLLELERQAQTNAQQTPTGSEASPKPCANCKYSEFGQAHPVDCLNCIHTWYERFDKYKPRTASVG